VAGILGLIDKIPDELITLGAEQYGEFVFSIEQIRHQVASWEGQDDPRRPNYLLCVIRKTSPIILIAHLLQKCPDQFPANSTSGLDFITETAFRDALRLDISDVNRAFANAEWKAATILAGSAIEALLLWSLKKHDQTAVFRAARDLTTGRTFQRKPPGDLDNWNLFQYSHVCLEVKIIERATFAQVDLARDFRNFIHPGVAIQSGKVCDRATALSAVAGLEHVVRDFTP
jgi:hypothetical protein